MDDKLLKLSTNLKNAIESNEDVVLLNSLDKEIQNNIEVVKLAKKKDECVETYNTVVRFYKEDSIEVSNALTNLHKAKLELDNHPLLREYMKSYSKVRDMYNRINFKLFSIINENNCVE